MQLPRLSLLDIEFPNSTSTRKPPLHIPQQTQQNHLNGQSTASPITFIDSHSQHNSQHRSIPIPVPLRSNQAVTNEYNNTFCVAQSMPISSQSTLISHSSSNSSELNGSIAAASLPTSLVATSGGKAKKTRTRTPTEQARELQKIFDINPLPNMKQRQDLGNLIGMTPRAVQVCMFPSPPLSRVCQPTHCIFSHLSRVSKQEAEYEKVAIAICVCRRNSNNI